MFAIKTHNCARIYSYEDAARLFNFPLGTRRKGWAENMRPLDSVTKQHLRVEEHNGYFDACLYNTPMARYYAPQRVLEGDRMVEVREVWYNLWDSQSASNFNHSVLGVSEETMRETTDGRRVWVGMNKKVSGFFPVRLLYVDGKLDVSRSKDAPIALGPHTSMKRIAQRKAFKQWLRPFQTMAVMAPDVVLYAFDVVRVRQTYEAGEMLNPDDIVGVFNHKGAAWIINQVYPTGDIPRMAEPFTEVV
jgi:hypothetical protein